jgi:hypothetical protein
MRRLAAFSGVVLAGCSLAIEAPLPPASNVVEFPDPAPLAQKLGRVVKDAQFVGPIETSPIRKAPITVLADWMLCLRGSVAAGEPQVYAVFFENNEIVNYRLAILIDGCASERFEPLLLIQLPNK